MRLKLGRTLRWAPWPTSQTMPEVQGTGSNLSVEQSRNDFNRIGTLQAFLIGRLDWNSASSPIQDYVRPDDQTQPTFGMNPGFKPFTVLCLIFSRS